MDAPAKICPFCHTAETERRADFSTSLMVSLHYCRRCRSYFEAIKWGDTAVPLDLPSFLAASPTLDPRPIVADRGRPNEEAHDP